MAIYTRLIDFIKNLDDRSFRLYGGLVLLTIIVIFGGMFYYYWRAQEILLRRLRRINQERAEIQTLINCYATVKKQQQEVEDLLQKDRNFLIAQYFKNILSELGLENKSTREPELIEDDLENEYSQIRLAASLSGLNMKQLTDLLYKLEQSPRVFLVEVDITKTPKVPTIDSNIVISTLQPKSPIATAE